MLRILTLSSLLATTVSFAAHTVNLERWTTTQGTPVYFVHAPEVPIVDIYVGFYAGSSRDEQLPGLANLTADILSQGVEGANADQIAETFENVAAQYSNSVDRDHADFTLRSLSDSKYLPVATNLFRKLLSQPTFPKEDFERLRQTQLAAIQQHHQSANSIANEAFFRTLYPNNPYGNPVLGTEDSVKKISTDDLKRFHKQFFVAKNAVISIVGNLEASQAKKLAEELSHALPEGQKAPAISVNASTSPQKIVISYPSSQTIIRMGQLGISRLSPDYFPLMVGNYTLGGGTLTSRLAYSVREQRGLAYDVGSDFQPMMSQGPFVIALGTRQAESQQALHVISETLEKFMKEGPTAEEIQAAKGYLIGGFPLRFDSNKKIAGTLLAIGLYGLPDDYLDTYISKINAVTKEQIQEAFKKHIQPSKMTTVLVGQELSKTNHS